MGERLDLALSLGLFSSGGLDDGTALLLQTVSRKCDFSRIHRVCDTGCGTGVLALALKKRFPGMDVTASDRDALALAFAGANAAANGLPLSLVPDRLLPSSKQYDLVLSNIPAKAGDPVIRDFFQRLPEVLNPGGRGAVVIVEPLRGLAESALDSAGARILHQEEAPGYWVSLFEYPEGPGPSGGAKPGDPYIRSELCFPGCPEKSFSGFYGVAEFDQLSRDTVLLSEILEGIGRKESLPAGGVLFENPGTGFLPVKGALAGALSGSRRIYYSSRDLLQLQAAAGNSGPVLARPPTLIHAPWSESLEGVIPDESLALWVSRPLFIPRSADRQRFLAQAGRFLRPGGLMAVAGRSSELSFLEKQRRGFHLLKQKKWKGHRVFLLKKQSR